MKHNSHSQFAGTCDACHQEVVAATKATVQVYQPYTTDTTPRGLLIARNAERARLADAPLWVVHEWLCHPGEECESGCDRPGIPERQALLDSDKE
jgi:hypothetical protein